MTEDEAKAAWEAAKEATSDARKVVSEAQTLMKRAERSLQKEWDAERLAWITYRDLQDTLARQVEEVTRPPKRKVRELRTGVR